MTNSTDYCDPGGADDGSSRHGNAPLGGDFADGINDAGVDADSRMANGEPNSGSLDHDLAPDRSDARGDRSPSDGPSRPGELEQALVGKMRVRHYAPSTVKNYVGWYRDYVSECRPPVTLAVQAKAA